MERGETVLLASIAIFLLSSILAYGKYGTTPVAENPTNGSNVTILAVDSAGKGVIGEASVTLTQGSGRILIGLDGSLVDEEAQASALTAAQAAAEATGKSVAGYDITYAFHLPVDVAAGPSAGAALAAATAAALQGMSLRGYAAITGTIASDGKIGASSAIRQKALAAMDNGIKVLLIPAHGGPDIDAYERTMQCDARPGSETCSTDYIADDETLSKELGITIKAVSNLTEALAYLVERIR